MLNFGNKEFRNLQEQVLKNAQDIETLKGRENLQIVIVEELPEEGNPNYIYLVPNNDEEESNVYDEYIWLADSEEYEKIGGVDIDLTNYVTLDGEQTISGSKTFSSAIKTNEVSADSGSLKLARANSNITITDSDIKFSRKAIPDTNNSADLGENDKNWRNLYLSGGVKIKATTANGRYEIISRNGYYLTFDYYNSLDQREGTPLSIIYGTRIDTYHVYPTVTNTYDLGSSSVYWKDLYLAGSLKDGANTVSVANIASKATSSYASGTFDSNGEDTIDISGGTPEGLFIFNCGNCQAMLHLTATMVQNAELTPIVVSCYYIETGTPQQGQLKISKSGTTLTLFLGASVLSHVDSGYAWTLTKTNLL